MIFQAGEVSAMKLTVVIHEAEEGGYWAEVPAISGCATQGESLEELLDNIYEAVEGCLSVEMPERSAKNGKVFSLPYSRASGRSRRLLKRKLESLI